MCHPLRGFGVWGPMLTRGFGRCRLRRRYDLHPGLQLRRPVPGLRAAWARWVAIASPWSGAKRGAGAYGYLGDLNRSDRSYGVGLTRGDYGRAGNERIVGKRKLAPRVGSVLLIRRGASSPWESGSKLPQSKRGALHGATGALLAIGTVTDVWVVALVVGEWFDGVGLVVSCGVGSVSVPWGARRA